MSKEWILLHVHVCNAEKGGQKAKEIQGKENALLCVWVCEWWLHILSRSSWAQHRGKATLTNGTSDLKKDSDKEEESDDDDQEEAASERTEGREVEQNSEAVTADVFADAEDSEGDDVRENVQGG